MKKEKEKTPSTVTRRDETRRNQTAHLKKEEKKNAKHGDEARRDETERNSSETRPSATSPRTGIFPRRLPRWVAPETSQPPRTPPCPGCSPRHVGTLPAYSSLSRDHPTAVSFSCCSSSSRPRSQQIEHRRVHLHTHKKTNNRPLLVRPRAAGVRLCPPLPSPATARFSRASPCRAARALQHFCGSSSAAPFPRRGTATATP